MAFSMARLASVLNEWLQGHELTAFEWFGQFVAVPEGMLAVRSWEEPAVPFPSVEIDGPHGRCWLTWYRRDVSSSQIPVVSMNALRLFLRDFTEFSAGKVNSLWRRKPVVVSGRGSKVAAGRARK